MYESLPTPKIVLLAAPPRHEDGGQRAHGSAAGPGAHAARVDDTHIRATLGAGERDAQIECMHLGAA